MLRGLTTISLWADDVAEAARWYAELLGVEPYFEGSGHGALSPAYVQFRIGDHQHELEIIDRRYAPPAARSGPGGAIVYWHVDDFAAAFEKLLAMGAKQYKSVTARGDAGFLAASVVDPFGNVLGVMHNPRYTDTLDRR
ncbi:VOC family protein [Nocardiopsis sp. NPDC049922]|uniref:VOC family protein n=1 Tax=Nocardiopsis sp. NPDC049922 TaxID=3155157 RepID=UPI0033F57ED2